MKTKDEILKEIYDKLVSNDPRGNWVDWENAKEGIDFWISAMDIWADQETASLRSELEAAKKEIEMLNDDKIVFKMGKPEIAEGFTADTEGMIGGGC